MISGFAPARLLRSAERVLRIQRGQDEAAGIATVQTQQCCAVLSGAASDVERDARQSMQERESGVLAFGLGLRRACEGAWGRAKCVVGAGRTRLRTADVDFGSRQAGRRIGQRWRAV